jgi:hypothetical protein
VDSRADLDAVLRRGKSCWELNPGRPARSLVTILTELRGLHTVATFTILMQM